MIYEHDDGKYARIAGVSKKVALGSNVIAFGRYFLYT
jgi:hypothetical protein